MNTWSNEWIRCIDYNLWKCEAKKKRGGGRFMISLYFIFVWFFGAFSIIFTCPEHGKVLGWPMKWFTSWRSKDCRWPSRDRSILVTSLFMTTSSSLTCYNVQWRCLIINILCNNFPHLNKNATWARTILHVSIGIS